MLTTEVCGVARELTRRWRLPGEVLLASVTLVLLASVGGAGAVAAPVLLPVQWLVARNGGRARRAFWTLLAALTAGEAAWALTYVAAGEREPLIWLVPLAVALVTFAGYAVTTRPSAPFGNAGAMH